MLVDTIVKNEENRVFFFFAGKQPRDGEEREQLPWEQEEAEASLAKLNWERKNGKQLLYFHYQPLAGGLAPKVQPKGQVVKRGIIQSLKTGAVLGFEEGQNLDEKMTKMYNRGAWTGEWL